MRRMYASKNLPADAPPGSLYQCRGFLKNRDTNQPIRWPRWFDLADDPEQPTDFEAFRCEPQAWKDKGLDLHEIVYRGRARLLFIPRGPTFAATPTSRRDLSGSLEEAKRRHVNPKLLIPGEECDYPGCHRLSEWRVSDEQEIDPERDTTGAEYERAITTRVRCYCSRHYRLPTFTTVRGVEREEEVEEGRPK